MGPGPAGARGPLPDQLYEAALRSEEEFKEGLVNALSQVGAPLTAEHLAQPLHNMRRMFEANEVRLDAVTSCCSRCCF